MIDRQRLRDRWIDESTWRRHEIAGRLASIGRSSNRELVLEIMALIRQVLDSTRVGSDPRARALARGERPRARRRP